MNEQTNDALGHGKRGDKGQIANGCIERMPIACFTDSWFQGKWDYADNQTVYWLVADGKATPPVVERVEHDSLIPGFFSMSGPMSFDYSTRKYVPDGIASDLDGASLARWMAETFDERKRLNNEMTWEECAPFDERDWLAMLDTPAIERWNRKRLTGSAGGPPSSAERVRAIARLVHSIEGLNGMSAETVLQANDVWDDGFWELDREALDRRFGPGCSCLIGRRRFGLLDDLVVVGESGDAYCLLSTRAPVVDENGRVRFPYLAGGDPKPISRDEIEDIWPEKDRWDITKRLD